MSHKTKNKTDRLVKAIKHRGLTAQGIMEKFGFATENSVYAVISKLRTEGFNITSRKNAQGVNTYRAVV